MQIKKSHCWIGAAILLHRRAGSNGHYVPLDPLCPMDIYIRHLGIFKCLQLLKKLVRDRIRTRVPRFRRPTLNRWATKAWLRNRLVLGYLYVTLLFERIFRLQEAVGSHKPVIFVCCCLFLYKENKTLYQVIVFRLSVTYEDYSSTSKLYTPSKLNIDLILWHTQLIV